MARLSTLGWVVAALALVLGACDGAEPAPTTSRPVTIPTTTTSSSVPGPDFGSAADLLNRVAPSFGVPPEFGGDRRRVSPELEMQYVEAFRMSPEIDGLAADLGVLDDDQLLYLGYLYCVGLDFEATALTSVGVVAGTVALAYGREPAGADDGDKAVAISAAKYAGGSICGQYQPETDQLLAQLGRT